MAKPGREPARSVLRYVRTGSAGPASQRPGSSAVGESKSDATTLLAFAPQGQDQLCPGIALVVRRERELHAGHPRCTLAFAALLHAQDFPSDLTCVLATVLAFSGRVRFTPSPAASSNEVSTDTPPAPRLRTRARASLCLLAAGGDSSPAASVAGSRTLRRENRRRCSVSTLTSRCKAAVTGGPPDTRRIAAWPVWRPEPPA